MVNKRVPKIEAHVVDAIRKLQTVQGSTQREIVNYISQEYNLSEPEVRRQIQVALKRGVTYGILQRLKGGYYTYNQQLFDRPLFDVGVEIPCNRKRRSRRKSRRRSSRRRRQRSRRGRRSRREKMNFQKGIDELQLKAKQLKRSSSLLKKDVPESEESSTTGKSDKMHE